MAKLDTSLKSELNKAAHALALNSFNRQRHALLAECARLRAEGKAPADLIAWLRRVQVLGALPAE
jgi:hypothetical protein